MHDELIAQSNIDSLDSLAFDAAAERFVLNYYMAHWYDEMDPDTMGADSSMCCDSMFTNFEQSDTLMECFHLYDGVRREVSNCNTNSLSFIHLPEESIPDPAPDPLFEFNFNPNDNGDPLTINDFSGANFHSFELFIDEDDGNIPDFINAVPPSGNRSVKINNDHTSFHVNRMERTFKVEDTDSLYTVSTALVLEDPGHSSDRQPFATIKFRDNSGSIIHSLCYVASSADPTFNVVQPPGQGTIVYRDWQCHEFDLSAYRNELVTVEYTASDCGWGGHYGYMYVADICKPCDEFPTIGLDSNFYECPEFPIEFCGTYNIDTSLYEIIGTYYEIRGSGGLVYLDSTVILDTPNIFCFRVNQDAADSIGIGCYDVYAVFDVINPNGDTISLRTLSSNPNTQQDVHNDFCVEEFCCPQDTINALISMNNCIAGGDFEESVMTIEGSFEVPDNYVFCNNYPQNVQGGYFTWDNFYQFGDIVSFSGTFNITNYDQIEQNNGEVTATIELCHETEDTSCVIPIIFDLINGQFDMCEDGGLMCMNFNPFWSYPSWQNHEGNYFNYLNLMLPFGTMINEEDTCEIEFYNIDIYLEGDGKDPKLYSSERFYGNAPENKNYFKLISLDSASYADYDNIRIELTNNCGDSCSLTLSFSGQVGPRESNIFIDDQKSEVRLILYPNPAEGSVNIEVLDQVESMQQIDIMDLNGRIIKQIRLNDQSKVKIQVEDLPNGIYLIQIKAGKQFHYTKFTKQ